MAGRPWGAPGGTSKGNGSALLNVSQPAPSGGEGARPRPSGLACALALILVFTIVVDILGNLLVILAVCRNKKLRNAGEVREIQSVKAIGREGCAPLLALEPLFTAAVA